MVESLAESALLDTVVRSDPGSIQTPCCFYRQQKWWVSRKTLSRGLFFFVAMIDRKTLTGLKHPTTFWQGNVCLSQCCRRKNCQTTEQKKFRHYRLPDSTLGCVSYVTKEWVGEFFWGVPTDKISCMVGTLSFWLEIVSLFTELHQILLTKKVPESFLPTPNHQ